MVFQTYLKDCDCKNDGTIMHEGAIYCRWCRTPYAKGGQINYEPEHFIKEVKGVDWEIVAAEKNGWVHKWNDFYAHHTNDCSKVGCNIHSVKRLSDGEVFSVGDCVDYVYGNFTIDKFEIKTAYGMDCQIWVSGGIVTITSHPEHGEFKNIRKPLQRTPLLITNDGVSLYNRNDKYWRVYEDFSIGMFEVSNAVSSEILAIFSARAKAEEYVLLSYRCLTANDVISLCEEIQFHNRLHDRADEDYYAIYVSLLKTRLRELSKQKLDKQ